MSGHTKGPWNAFTQESFSGWWSVEDAEGQEVGSGDGGFYEADARLIAASPDLLEALIDIADDYSERFDMDSPSTNPGMKIVVENARAAIAKARGEK